MIYLDNAATTFQKPEAVYRAVLQAMRQCASPGRGGYAEAVRAEETVYRTRALASELFSCQPEQVCFTSCATEGLNAAIRTLVRPGDRVVISGLEHNAVTRTLHAVGAAPEVVTAPLFSPDDWAAAFDRAITPGTAAVICTHVSNVFGAVLPIYRISRICAERGVPLIVDASQSAGILPVSLKRWRAAFVAMPGHKGLYGPQGTGLLLCGRQPDPLLFGGTGSSSADAQMPDFLPDRMEAGTRNVPGIAGLGAGLQYLRERNLSLDLQREQQMISRMADGLVSLGADVYAGQAQAGVLSFRIPDTDPVEAAGQLADSGIAVRAGLHCAPLAHRTAGTFPDGTIRVSVSSLTVPQAAEVFLRRMGGLFLKKPGAGREKPCYFSKNHV